jgi:hypothetical protein
LCKSREEKEALQKFHEAELEQVAKLVFIEQTTASSLELKNALQDQRAVHTVALTKVREQLKSALEKNTLKDFQRTSLDKLVSEKLKDVTEIHNRKNKVLKRKIQALEENDTARALIHSRLRVDYKNAEHAAVVMMKGLHWEKDELKVQQDRDTRKIEGLFAQKNVLQTLYDGSCMEVEVMATSNKVLQGKLEDSRMEVEVMATSNEALREKLEDSRMEVDAVKGLNEDSRMQVEGLFSRNDKLQSQYECSLTEITNLNQKLVVADARVVSLEKQGDLFRGIRDGQLAVAQNTIQVLNGQLSAAQTQLLEVPDQNILEAVVAGLASICLDKDQQQTKIVRAPAWPWEIP